jgi:hypothetical protein
VTPGSNGPRTLNLYAYGTGGGLLASGAWWLSGGPYKTPSVTSGLVLHSDFSNSTTYPTPGATFYNLVDSVAQSIITLNSGSYSYSPGNLIFANPVSAGGATYIQLASYTFQTISLWFTPITISSIDYIIDARNLSVNTYGYYSITGSTINNIQTGSACSIFVNGGASYSGNSTGQFPTVGTLMNVTFVFSSALTGNAFIGCRYSLENGWNVKLSRIVVYNRALSQSENASNYTALS